MMAWEEEVGGGSRSVGRVHAQHTPGPGWGQSKKACDPSIQKFRDILLSYTASLKPP